MSTPTLVACPTCGAAVEWGPQSPNRPFCSERCKLIDLGAWASEEHAIAGDSLEDDVFSGELPPRHH
ncbi:MAG: DNA gyrase inhibitor YacG [Pseudomonas sp.]|nr:DNA gyrase inhibitor YacG [Pseudomonas sp.]